MAQQEGPMRKVQVRLPDELVKVITDEAETQDRSVSYVVRKVLEEFFSPALRVAPASNTARPSRVQGVPKGARALCPHDSVTKKPGASGGLVKTCSDCGEVLLR